MGSEVVRSVDVVRGKESFIVTACERVVAPWREATDRLAQSPDLLSFPAAALIVIATFWAALQLAGLTANTIDLSIAPVSLQSTGAGSSFCRIPPPAPGDTGVSDTNTWAFPLYACGAAGIGGPVGPVQTVPATGGQMILETVDGSSAIYTVMMTNTAIVATPDATGAEFRDGYAFSPAFVTSTGMSMAEFSRQCEVGFSPAPISVENPTPYGAGQASYAPGTPSMTPDGGYVCGDTHIISGDLNLSD